MDRCLACVFATALLFSQLPGWTQSPQPALGEWIKRASMGMGIRTEPGVVALNGKVYAIGGSTRVLDDLATGEVYDPATDRWSAIATMPSGVNHNSAVALNGKIYIVGGFSGRPPGATGPRVHQGAEAHLQEYDPISNTWRKLAPMKSPRGSVGAAALDGKIHALGGRGRDVGTVTTHAVYDPAANSWSDRAPMPTARDHMATIAVNGRIHVVGGRLNERDDNVANHDIYDPETNSWSVGPPAPTARSGGQFALIDDFIVFFGGETSRRTFSENEAFDLTANRWIILPPGPTGLHASAGAVVGDSVYYPGGSTGPGGDAVTDQLLVFRLRRALR